jgi:hypothetical protein
VIYGIIESLAEKQGYAYIRNKRLKELLNNKIGLTSIIKSISNLEVQGYITVETNTFPNTVGAKKNEFYSERKIFILKKRGDLNRQAIDPLTATRLTPQLNRDTVDLNRNTIDLSRHAIDLNRQTVDPQPPRDYIIDNIIDKEIDTVIDKKIEVENSVLNPESNSTKSKAINNEINTNPTNDMNRKKVNEIIKKFNDEQLKVFNQLNDHSKDQLISKFNLDYQEEIILLKELKKKFNNLNYFKQDQSKQINQGYSIQNETTAYNSNKSVSNDLEESSTVQSIQGGQRRQDDSAIIDTYDMFDLVQKL